MEIIRIIGLILIAIPCLAGFVLICVGLFGLALAAFTAFVGFINWAFFTDWKRALICFVVFALIGYLLLTLSVLFEN